MDLLDIKEFEELLSLQAERSRQYEENAEPSSQRNMLQKYTKQESCEELQRATERLYKPEDLPEGYFFSALSELVLQ